ncbi:MAG: DegT/DnrJ/EryC1/StrS family aminotransferase [Actinomycetota bacterium]
MATTIPATPLSGPPAAFGGAPAFPEGLPFVRPTVPDADAVVEDVRKILGSGMLTNASYVRELERRAAEYLGVRHCVAVSSCTSGLMLVLRASELTGDVVMPSFTFVATAHAAAWNGLRPVFADIDPQTLTLSAAQTLLGIGVRTSAILATHTYGTPCDIEGLVKVARRDGIRLFFDAAHAFGSRYQGTPIGGFGDAEVFSLSPTKVLVAGEGGIIATNDDILAQRCRIGRDYANPGDYNARFVGLNARMSEFHAAVALASLEGLEERIARRNEIAELYRGSLSGVPGVSFPVVPAGDRSTYKDLTILVDETVFGCDASQLARTLADDGIDTRRYYAPPVHEMRPYRRLKAANGFLEATVQAAGRVLTLPLWMEMSDATVVRVSDSVRRVQSWYESRNGRSARAQAAISIEDDATSGAPGGVRSERAQS